VLVAALRLPQQTNGNRAKEAVPWAVVLVSTINRATVVVAAAALPGTATSAVSRDTGRLSVRISKLAAAAAAAAAVMVAAVGTVAAVVVALLETATSAASLVISQISVRTKAAVVAEEATVVAVVVATAAAVVATAVAVVATVADMAEPIKIEKSGHLWPHNERYDTTGKTKGNTFLTR